MDQIAALGIDFTSLLVYLVNFGAIYLIVSRLIAKPIVELLDSRKAEIENNLNEANKLRIDLLAEKKSFEEEKIKLRKEYDEELRNFEKSLNDRKKELEEENSKTREEIIQKALSEQKQIKENVFKIIQEDLIKSYSTILSKILKDDTNSDKVKSSLENSWNKFKKEKL